MNRRMLAICLGLAVSTTALSGCIATDMSMRKAAADVSRSNSPTVSFSDPTPSTSSTYSESSSSIDDSLGMGSSSPSSTGFGDPGFGGSSPSPSNSYSRNEAAAKAEESRLMSKATPAGSKLKFGQTANVPITTLGRTSLIGLTVTGVEKGDNADLRVFKNYATQMSKLTPYYIKLKISKGEGDPYQTFTSPYVYMKAANSGGLSMASLTPYSKFPKCDRGEAPREFTEGSSYESCIMVAGAPGESLSQVAYLGKYGQKYDSSPITWQP